MDERGQRLKPGVMRNLANYRRKAPSAGLVVGQSWSAAGILALGALAALLDGLSLLLFIPLIRSLSQAPAPLHGLEGWIANALTSVPPSFVVIAVVAMLCLAVVAKNIAAFAGLWLTRRAEGQVAHDLRLRIFDQTLSSCIDYRAGHRRAETVTTMAENTWKVAGAFGLTLRLVICAGTILVFIALMMLISARLALFTLLFLCAGALIVRLITRRAALVGHAVVQENKAFGTQIWESINALQLIRTFGREEHEASRFGQSSERLRGRLLRLDGLWALPGPITEVLIVILIGGLVLVARSSAVGIASLAAFLSLLYRVQAPARELMSNKVAIDGMDAAIADVATFLDETREPFLVDGNQNAAPLHSAMSLDKVSFRYAADQPLALRDVSLTIPAGKTTAIVGPSGAGKSSLIGLLFRFYDPSDGRVTADGIPLSRLRLSSWRGRLAMMSQEVQLFNDTIAANIAYGDLNAGPDAIKAAARVAHADGFIEAMPQGYQTVVGDRGLRLSGGQRQRIALARTILRNPDVLILDEATNALDPEAEAAFQEALTDFAKGRTLIVIAHRLSTVMRADQVVVMDQGKIVEVGSPAELIAKNGKFAQLHRVQQAGFDTRTETVRGV